MPGPPVRSLWLHQALTDGFEPAPRLEGDHRADVCIVGGGYTGLWTALHLKELEPSLDVALVESDVCGGGASGRNGGFVLSWWSKFVTMEKLCGREEALRLCGASADAVGAIGAFCRDHGIDAGFRHDGWLWAATNPAQMGSWLTTVAALERAGVAPFRRMDGHEAGRRAGSAVHLGGVLEASGATVQPAHLAMGLRRVATERGVRLFERSPMVSLRHRGRTRVSTPGGSVSADRVVLALNAWGIRFRQIRRSILVVGSDIVATDPIPNRLVDIGWTDGLCVSDSRLLVHYYRITPDGRIAFGKGGGRLAFGGIVGPRFEGRSPRAGRCGDAFRFTYPMLADVPVTSSWTGPIDRSRTGLPVFDRLEEGPDVVYGVGYSGNGVGPSFLGGKILASLALGRNDEWGRCGLVGRRPPGFPPEPFRSVGGLTVRAAIERAERAQDGGRRPRRIDSALMRLAPAGLVPVTRRA